MKAICVYPNHWKCQERKVEKHRLRLELLSWEKVKVSYIYRIWDSKLYSIHIHIESREYKRMTNLVVSHLDEDRVWHLKLPVDADRLIHLGPGVRQPRMVEVELLGVQGGVTWGVVDGRLLLQRLPQVPTAGHASVAVHVIPRKNNVSFRLESYLVIPNGNRYYIQFHRAISTLYKLYNTHVA